MSAANDPRALMVELGHLLYSRSLTNSAGGNLSCRVGDHIYITPRYLGSKHRWKLREEMVLVFDRDFNILEGDPTMVSRESPMHFSCYKHFPQINGVIHAHPLNLNVFAATGMPVTPTNQYTEKFGALDTVPNLPSHSQELADAVVAKLASRAGALEKQALGLILAWHGVVTVGRDLAEAYDTLDRLEWSAYTLLMARAGNLEIGP